MLRSNGAVPIDVKVDVGVEALRAIPLLRWRTPARLNVLANYANFVVLAVVNLLLTPLLIGMLGTASFGIWKACLRFLDLTSFADGRATQALKWVSAFRSGTVDVIAQRRLTGAAVAVWLIWAPLLLVVLAGIVFAMPLMIHGLSIQQAAMARTAASILAVNVLLAGLLGLPDAVLIGANRGFLSMNLNTLFVVVSNVGYVIAASTGHGIITLTLITLCASVLNALLTWFAVRRNVAWWGICKPRYEEVTTLARFSGWTLAWMLAQGLFLSGELILFSWLVGADAVAGYSVTSYATQCGLSICMLTVAAKGPGIAQALGDGRNSDAADGISRCRELVIAAAAVIGGVTLLVNHSFVALWAGDRLYLGGNVNALIVLAFFQFAVLRCDAQLQDATLSIQGRGIAGLAVAIGSIAAGWIGFRLTARIEVAYGLLIAARAVLHVLFPRALRLRVGRARMPWRLLVVSGGVLFMAYVAGRNDFTVQTWPLLVMTTGIAAGIAAALVAAALSAGTRRSLLGLAK